MTPQTYASATAVEPPILWLGMSGFDPQNRSALERDFTPGKASISPRAQPAELQHAVWHKRPDGARDVPDNFVPRSAAQLAWAYVRHTDRDMLPARYRVEPIYYRRVPRVPLRWLRDSQLTLLHELSVESGTFDSLHQRTSLPVRRIQDDLTCLYYAGAITTTRDRAALTPVIGHVDTQPHSSAAGLESLLSREALSHYPGDAAALELTARQRILGLFAHPG